MWRRILHALLRRPGIQRHTVASEYEAEVRRIVADFYHQRRPGQRDFAAAALQPDSLPDWLPAPEMRFDLADEIAVQRDYAAYRYDYRLPGERVL